MDLAIILSIPSIIALIFLCLAFGDDVLVAFDRSKKASDPYEEYGTNAYLEKAWFDNDSVGTKCSDCGCSDAPGMETDFPYSTFRCKWCFELLNLNYHLRMNGQRRFRR